MGRWLRLGRWAGSRFRAISGSERWLTLQAAGWLPLMFLGLRLYGFNRWYERLRQWGERPSKRALAPVETTEQAQRVGRIVNVVARYGLFRGNCLHRSLTLWWLLRQRGAQPDLRIGARRREGRFEAHAWVEWRGVVLNDSPDVGRQYAPFEQAILPPGARLR
jgi:hypothetical protein